MSLLALCLIVLGAFTTEAAIGFGSTVLTVALGAHLFPIDRLLAAFVPVNVGLSAWLVLRNRHAIDGPLLLLCGPGSSGMTGSVVVVDGGRSAML